MRNRKNILIVDDSKIEQVMLRSKLQKEGYTVYTAETVSEGLAVLGMEDVGIVLVDFYLAGYNNGAAMVKKIRRYRVDVLIYAISSSQDTSRELLDSGCDGILSKNPSEIVEFLLGQNSSAQDISPSTHQPCRHLPKG